MTTAAHRIATTVTPELSEAVAAAVEADLVAENAPESERLREWALYGYRAWRQARAREEKLAAYREIAEDPERREALEAASRAAVEAGLL